MTSATRDVADSTAQDLALARELFKRVCADLAMIVDHAIEVQDVRVERARRRPAGEGAVHLSFRMVLERAGRHAQGCLLVPFADALRLSGYLIMLSEDEIARRTSDQRLEEDVKSGMLELSSFVANAADAALRTSGLRGTSVRPEGCQGVRAGVRPRLEYVEGEELLVGRARVRVHEAPPGELIVLLPADLLRS